MTATAHRKATDSSAAVDAFMATLDHPNRDAIAALRGLFAALDPGIAEGIKWNAPSWRTTEYFATTNLRERHGLGLVLHLGAKARTLPADGLAIADPTNLLDWRGGDRALVHFADRADLEAKRPALEAVLRQWLQHV